jgi:hypothetical protein
MGASFHPIGVHFHGGHFRGHGARGHRNHDFRDGVGDVGADTIDYSSDSAQGEPVVLPAPEVVTYVPAAPAYVSEGPRIIILDHRRVAQSRRKMPIVIYGSPAP